MVEAKLKKREIKKCLRKGIKRVLQFMEYDMGP